MGAACSREKQQCSSYILRSAGAALAGGTRMCPKATASSPAQRWSRKRVPAQAPSAPRGPARFSGHHIKRCPGGCNCPWGTSGFRETPTPVTQTEHQSTKSKFSFKNTHQSHTKQLETTQLIRQCLSEAALYPTSSMPCTSTKTSSFTSNTVEPQPTSKQEAKISLTADFTYRAGMKH